MQPLIDADILLHEIGWSGEFKDKETGAEVNLSSDHVLDLLDRKIQLICEDVGATHPPILFITDSLEITRRLNKVKRWQGEPERVYVPNFRYKVAKARPYKGTRKNPKPFHFYNIIFYLMAEYCVVLSEDGLEADDMMCIEQRANYEESWGSEEVVPTIICSRDKDLRICPGHHFSWECGNQRAVGPVVTDKIGWLQIDKKVIGYGLSFFYFQMLTGDTADNIPGLKGWGDAKAYKLLHELKTEKELFLAVKSTYIDVLGKEIAKGYFMEQATLLWMVQEKGKPYELFRS